MVSTISLPMYQKPKVGVDGVYTHSGCDACGQQTPTTVSPSSSYALSPISVRDEAYSAFASLHEGYDMMDGTSVFLGSGASGCVWSGRCRATGRSVAVKTVNMPSYGPSLFNESVILKRVQHISGAVHLIDSFSDDDYEILVMELCHGDDLQRWRVGELTLHELKRIMRDLFTCIIGVHAMGISHGDIRLENVIAHFGKEKERANTKRSCIKLIDFGSSVSSIAEACVDYISAGKLLFELIVGHRASVVEILACRELPAHYGDVLDLIRLLMRATPTNFCETGKSALNHAWLTVSSLTH